MLIKFICLMPVLAAFMFSKNASNEVKLLAKIIALAGPGLLQWYWYIA